MLLDLHIQDFALAGRIDIEFGPGLNVLTGETGAGKSIIIDAVSALIGGRAGAGDVREGHGARNHRGRLRRRHIPGARVVGRP